MATVIDSLIVTLGLDNKDFQQGMKDTEEGLSNTRKNTDRVGKQIAASGKDAAEFFGQMQRSAIKFFAVLTTGKGLLNFTRDVVSTGGNLYRLSQNLDISADTLHRWGRAAELNGGSMEGFLGTLQNLGGQVTEIFMKGDSAITPYLRQLGVSVTDAAGKAKPLTDILADISSATEKAFPNQQQRYSYLKQMGFDEGTVNLLVKGGKELRNVIAAQQEYSDRDNKASFEAEQTWIKAQQRLEKLTRDLVIKILPSLERMIEAFVKFAEVIIPPLSQAVDIFAELDEKTDGWSTSLLLALATLRLIGGSAVIGGIASLSATMAGLAAGAASLAAPLGFLLHSGGLNKGEDEEIRKLQGDNYMGPTIENKGPDMTGVDNSSPARRNLNPGNINFAGQEGATKSGRFAKFETVEAGVAQMYKQLAKYEKGGLNTIEQIISKWAPSNENDTEGYIKFVSDKMGVARDSQISMTNPSQAAALISAMAKKESGWSLTERQLWGGIGQAFPRDKIGDRGAAQPTEVKQLDGKPIEIKPAEVKQLDVIQGNAQTLEEQVTMSDLLMGLGSREAWGDPHGEKQVLSGINMAQGGGGGNSSVSIGQITVNTQATDARGIASGLKGEIVRQHDAGLR